jgi:hypothetical protein
VKPKRAFDDEVLHHGEGQSAADRTDSGRIERASISFPDSCEFQKEHLDANVVGFVLPGGGIGYEEDFRCDPNGWRWRNPVGVSDWVSAESGCRG